jgi:hypothetical protein
MVAQFLRMPAESGSASSFCRLLRFLLFLVTLIVSTLVIVSK